MLAEIIVSFLAVAGLIAWVKASILRIESGQIGIRMADGRVYRSGFYFIPKFFKSRPLSVPLQHKIDFAEIIAYSGPVSGCESEPLAAAITLFLNFPHDTRLRDIIQSGMPMTKEGLLNLFDPIVIEETKAIFGEFSWREITSRTQMATRLIALGLIGQGLFESFTDNGGTFNLVIENVDLPEEIKQTLSYRDQMGINAEAANNVARVKAAVSFRAHLERMSQATGKSIADLQKEIRENPKAIEAFIGVSFDLMEKTSSLNGQFYDGRRITHFNLSGEAKDGRELATLGVTAGRMMGSGTQQKGEENTPKETQSFWRDKKPMGQIHARRK